MENQEIFSAVRQIRDFLKEHETVKLTTRYLAEKKRLVRTFPQKEDRWKWYARTASRTAYLHKAVMKAVTVDFLQTSLGDRDTAIRAGDNEKAVDILVTAMGFLEKAKTYGIFDAHPRGSGPGRWSEYWKEHAADRPKAIKTSKAHGRAVSKRAGLGKLPLDWQEAIHRVIPDIRLDLLEVTGCRPSELKDLEIRIENELLVIEIAGKKVKESGHHCGLPTGQKRRTLTIDPISPAVQRIYQSIQNGIPLPEMTPKVLHALRQRLARKSLELFPKTPQISFYSYRHQVLSDLKATSGDPEEIARVAGHQSVRTQQVYGRKASGKGRSGIVKVTASSNVRPDNRTTVRLHQSPSGGPS